MNCDNCQQEAATLLWRAGHPAYLPVHLQDCGVWVCVACVPLYDEKKIQQAELEDFRAAVLDWLDLINWKLMDISNHTEAPER